MESRPKIDYYQKSLEIISGLPRGKRPSLLIHACCGPCATHPIIWLAPHFDVTLYYQNSNIRPYAEYLKRLGEVKKLLGYYEQDYGYEFKLIVPEYHEDFLDCLIPLKDEPEGGKRCLVCYKKRMEEGYLYAKEHGYEYFATLMTISREKDSQVLNALGSELEAKYQGPKYFHSDFKKAQGGDVALRLRKHYGLYYQNFCGCPFSKRDAKGELLDYYKSVK